MTGKGNSPFPLCMLLFLSLIHICIAFNAISDKKDCYVDAIKYYIKNDTPNNLHPYHLVDTLFSLLSDLEVYEIIIGEEYSQKNVWVYAYYHELPPELITEKHLHGLYAFLKDTSDGDITSSSMRDVDFLEKYNVDVYKRQSIRCT